MTRYIEPADDRGSMGLIIGGVGPGRCCLPIFTISKVLAQ